MGRQAAIMGVVPHQDLSIQARFVWPYLHQQDCPRASADYGLGWSSVSIEHAEIGKSYRYMTQKVHVFAFVVDGTEGLVVLKRWYKFRWNYEVMPSWLFCHMAEKYK